MHKSRTAATGTGLVSLFVLAALGCSGTGSIVVEQLARNCIGELVLVDSDHVEHKNLNRIVNSTADDAGASAGDVARFNARGIASRAKWRHGQLR